MTLGERIRRLRRDRDWSQDELGSRVRINGRHISRYENDRMRPSAATLRRMADVFDVSLDELMETDEQPGRAGNGTGIKDPELLEAFREVDRLNDDDRTVAKKILQALVMKQELVELLARRG